MLSNRKTIQVVLAALGLALLTAAAYWQVSSFGFINLDDPNYILKNEHVKGGLTSGGVWWALTSVNYYYWQPLTWISHMVDVEMFGLRAGGHHVVNVALHVMNTVLVFLVFVRMTGSVWRSAMVGVLFGVHPMRVESVAWVAERKDVLSGLFWILAMGAYGMGRRVWVLVFFGLGILSKPTVVTLPFALLLLDVWPLGRIAVGSRGWVEQAKGCLKEKTPMLVLAAGASAVTVFGQQNIGAMVTLGTLPLWYRVNNALVAYVRYLGKFFWPVDLGVVYPYERIEDWQVFSAVLVLAGVTAGVVVMRRRAPYLLVGWLWFLGVLVPMIGLAQSGVQSMADRFTYLAFIGLFAAVVWGGADVLGRVRGASVVVSVILIPVLAVMSLQQAGYWKGSFPLFEHTVAVTKDNDVLHINLGSLYAERESYPMAVSHLKEAVRIEPRRVDTRYMLVEIYVKQDDRAAAIEECRAILRIRPDYEPARRMLGQLAGGAN